jgi:TolB-like protein/DNA-binding winged helix-turn-helix (wHTH) protein
MSHEHGPLRFGPFAVDPKTGELRKHGVRLRLQEQPLQVLLALLENPQEVVTREELQKRLWAPGVTVDFDQGINKAVNRLREVLGDNADRPVWIETLPQRGYRFVGSLQERRRAETAAVTPMPEAPAAQAAHLSRRGILVLGGGLLAAVPAGILAYRRFGASSPVGSIAVLPLENLSGNPEEDYFSDGMTDELIAEIARIGTLRVTSRTSIVQYKASSKDKQRKSLPQIGKELDVDAILEGTVLRSAGTVRIVARLIRTSDDRNLWSETYQRNISDVLGLQGEIARTIAGAIRIELSPRQQAWFARPRSRNPEAHEAFLRGTFWLNSGIRGIARSREFFQRAIELDNTNAEAHAGLAEALCYAAIFGLRPALQAFPEARAAAQRALELDPSNPSALNALADVKKGYDWDLRAAEVQYKQALASNPSHMLATLWYAECLSRMERHEEAIALSRRALALDPVSPLSYSNLAMLNWHARRFDPAIQFASQALELDPVFVNAFWWRSMAYAGKGEYALAIENLTAALKLNAAPLFLALLGHVKGLAGDRPGALAMLKRLDAAAAKTFVSPVDFALIHAGLSETDQVFTWIERAYEAKAARIHELRLMYFDNVRNDSRYHDLMRRVGLRE